MESPPLTSAVGTDTNYEVEMGDSTEQRDNHVTRLDYYLSTDGLDSLGPGTEYATCYIPTQPTDPTDPHKWVYFAITDVNLKKPGPSTVFPLSGPCAKSKASMKHYKTGQFAQVDTVRYHGYRRPDTDQEIERTFRSDRKLPTDQTAEHMVAVTEQGTPIGVMVHHWGCELVKQGGNGCYTDLDAPVRSPSDLYPGQTLWRAKGRVMSDAPFLDYRDEQTLTEQPTDEEREARRVQGAMKVKRELAERLNGGPEAISEAAWRALRSMGPSGCSTN